MLLTAAAKRHISNLKNYPIRFSDCGCAYQWNFMDEYDVLIPAFVNSDDLPAILGILARKGIREDNRNFVVRQFPIYIMELNE